MKKCSRCKIEKNENEFGKNKRSNDGLWCYCKQCVSIIGKIDRENKKDILNEKSRLYREKNPEKFKECCRKSYLKHQEKKIAFQRQYYWENRNEISEKNKRKHGTEIHKSKQRKYYHENRERIKKQNDAHKMVAYAVKLGVIIKPEICEVCKEKCLNLDGHHKNHDKQLEVIWVCRKCHRNIEKKEKLI